MISTVWTVLSSTERLFKFNYLCLYLCRTDSRFSSTDLHLYYETAARNPFAAAPLYWY